MRDKYFEWLYDMMCKGRYVHVSYRKLLGYLYDTEFTFSIPRDANRAEDGIDLRRRCPGFESKEDARYLSGPCNVLEMMVALAVRMEETIMDNASIGDRTAYWFWGMITNMGLGSMTDDVFDGAYVEGTVQRFLNRDYKPDGKGGLFHIRNCECDLRDVEIWYQLCWYLDEVYE